MIATSILAAVTAGTALLGCQGATAPSQGITGLQPCSGAVITVVGDAPTGCDLTPPQRLDVSGITRAACDDMGGRWSPAICRGVDY